ncbi:MAG: Trm112 family protein [archaeon]|nr:Trm112 family protein [archaeon]
MAKEIPKELLEILACPKCKGNLQYKKVEQKLECKNCKLAFRVEEGIPVMLIKEAKKIK